MSGPAVSRLGWALPFQGVHLSGDHLWAATVSARVCSLEERQLHSEVSDQVCLLIESPEGGGGARGGGGVAGEGGRGRQSL